MDINVIGVDIAKHVFQFHGVNERGKALLRKRLRRGEVLAYLGGIEPCVVVLEACGGSHYWGREIGKLGHTVKLIPPQFVKPYVKTNKTDAADAEAICEAAQRENMRFVPVKKVEQQDLQMLHRVRERLVKARTALCNEIRGLLHEYGVVISQGRPKLRRELPIVLEESNILSACCVSEMRGLHQELVELDEKISSYDRKLELISKEHPVCRRLQTIPGVGPMVATAIVAASGDPHQFKNGRSFAAWLGLVPRQKSSGGKHKLLGISKRGDGYIRKLLVHGARIVMRYAGRKQDQRSRWIVQLNLRRGWNKTCVALANKNARVIWALLTKDEVYKEFPSQA